MRRNLSNISLIYGRTLYNETVKMPLDTPINIESGYFAPNPIQTLYTARCCREAIGSRFEMLIIYWKPQKYSFYFNLRDLPKKMT